MPSLERTQYMEASRVDILRVLAAVERWPAWSGLVRRVEPARPEDAPAIALPWMAVGVLGHMPFSGIAQSGNGQAGARSLTWLTTSSPVEAAGHTITIEDEDGLSRVTWRVDYRFAGGPGGMLVERFVVRRGLPAQIERALAGLAQAAGGQLRPAP